MTVVALASLTACGGGKNDSFEAPTIASAAVEVGPTLAQVEAGGKFFVAGNVVNLRWRDLDHSPVKVPVTVAVAVAQTAVTGPTPAASPSPAMAAPSPVPSPPPPTTVATTAPAPMVAPAAPVAAPAPAQSPVAALVPVPSAPPAGAAPVHPGLKVDTSGLPVAMPGVSVEMLTSPGGVPPLITDPFQEGAFRLLCNWSKMSFDDPIVYPGQPGLAHHHTFFGNTGIDASTTAANIRSVGNATCRGGTINKSGYWAPSMIDTSSNKPLAPKFLIIYYKTGYWPYMSDGSIMQPLPKGLKMIAGSAAATSAGDGEFSCFMPDGNNRPGTWGRSIPPHCETGDAVRTRISFPQCWDGINLDSPDHKSHMATPVAYRSADPARPFHCPPTHPVVLPMITFTIDYDVPQGADTSKWRLASDDYDVTKPGGFSIHADWMNGWDTAVSDLWGVKCMRERRDCGSANLGDGRGTIEFQGN